MKGSVHLIENQTAPGNGVITGLCIECAMRHHDYMETLRHEAGVSETPLPQAWIDGRRYMLLFHAWTHQETYSECNRKTPSLYMRMK